MTSQGADSGAVSGPTHPHTTRVAVVIVSFNSADVVGRCLETLRDGARGVELVSVVLADNDSRDASIAVASEAWPEIVVLRTGGNLGYAGALNRGRRASAPHDAMLVLNPDTALRPGAVHALANAAVREGCGIAVPRMLAPEGSLSLSLRRRPSVKTALAEALLGGARAGHLGLSERVTDPAEYCRARDVDWATGAAVMISSTCWSAVGDWDESFFLYSEETEYMLRAIDAGHRVRYVPEAVCVHRGGESGSEPQLWSLLMVNKVRLYRRSHGRVHSAMFRAVLLLGQGLRALTGSSPALAAVGRLLRPIKTT